jgi:hypothetical protein
VATVCNPPLVEKSPARCHNLASLSLFASYASSFVCSPPLQPDNHQEAYLSNLRVRIMPVTGDFS